MPWTKLEEIDPGIPDAKLPQIEYSPSNEINNELPETVRQENLVENLNESLRKCVEGINETIQKQIENVSEELKKWDEAAHKAGEKLDEDPKFAHKVEEGRDKRNEHNVEEGKNIVEAFFGNAEAAREAVVGYLTDAATDLTRALDVLSIFAKETIREHDKIEKDSPPNLDAEFSQKQAALAENQRILNEDQAHIVEARQMLDKKAMETQQKLDRANEVETPLSTRERNEIAVLYNEQAKIDKQIENLNSLQSYVDMKQKEVDGVQKNIDTWPGFNSSDYRATHEKLAEQHQQNRLDNEANAKQDATTAEQHLKSMEKFEAMENEQDLKDVYRKEKDPDLSEIKKGQHERPPPPPPEHPRDDTFG